MDEILNELRELKNQVLALAGSKHPDAPLTTREAMEWLGYSDYTWFQENIRPLIRHYKLGKQVLYMVEDLKEFLKKHEVRQKTVSTNPLDKYKQR